MKILLAYLTTVRQQRSISNSVGSFTTPIVINDNNIISIITIDIILLFLILLLLLLLLLWLLLWLLWLLFFVLNSDRRWLGKLTTTIGNVIGYYLLVIRYTNRYILCSLRNAASAASTSAHTFYEWTEPPPPLHRLYRHRTQQ